MKDNEVNKIQGELQGDPMRLTPKLWETWINFSLCSLRIHSYIYKLLKICAVLVLCVLMCNGSRGPIILCIFFFYNIQNSITAKFDLGRVYVANTKSKNTLQW